MCSSGQLEEQIIIAIELLIEFNHKEVLEVGKTEIEKKLSDNFTDKQIKFENNSTISNIIEDKNENKNNTHLKIPNSHSIPSLVVSRRYLGQFYWSIKDDDRIVDLLNYACDFSSKANLDMINNNNDIENDTNYNSNIVYNNNNTSMDPKFPSALSSMEKKDSQEKEMEEKKVLQNALIVLKESARNIAFICRGEE